MGSLRTEMKGHNPADVIIRKDLFACMSVLAYHGSSMTLMLLGCTFDWRSQLERNFVLFPPLYTIGKRRGLWCIADL